VRIRKRPLSLKSATSGVVVVWVNGRQLVLNGSRVVIELDARRTGVSERRRWDGILHALWKFLWRRRIGGKWRHLAGIL